MITSCGVQEDNNNEPATTLPAAYESDALEIFMTMGGAQITWVYEVHDVSKVVENSDLVLKVLITDWDQLGHMIGYDRWPETTITGLVLDVYSGNYEKDVIEFNQYGGIVLWRDVVENTNPDALEKREWDNFTDEELDSLYVEYTSQYGVDIEVGKEYIVALNLGDHYFLGANGYCVFEVISENESTLVMKNLLTGNTGSIDF